jgi:hypothetical protein
MFAAVCAKSPRTVSVDATYKFQKAVALVMRYAAPAMVADCRGEKAGAVLDMSYPIQRLRCMDMTPRIKEMTAGFTDP